MHEHLEAGGWAFVHDPVRQYRHLCACYPDARAWKEAAAQAVRDRRPFPRGASIGGEVADLVELVIELGERHGPRLRKKLVVDETSLVVKSGSGWIGKRDNVLVSMRRHLGIEPIWLQQRIAQLGRQFYEMCTDVYLYALGNPDGLEALEKYLNLPPATLDIVPTLEPFHFVHAVNGQGLV